MSRPMTPEELEQHRFQFMLARILGKKYERREGDFVCITYEWQGSWYVEKLGHFPDNSGAE